MAEQTRIGDSPHFVDAVADLSDYNVSHGYRDDTVHAETVARFVVPYDVRRLDSAAIRNLVRNALRMVAFGEDDVRFEARRRRQGLRLVEGGRHG
jgi:hypothetical protein